MKIKEIIKEIFNETPLDIAYIPTGLTNDNYKVRLRDKTIVIRIPREENKAFFNYELEENVLEMIRPLNLDTQLLYYNKETGIKCNTYVDNCDIFTPVYIQRAARLIRTLHDAALSSGITFDIKTKFEHYRKENTVNLYDTSFAWPYLDKLEHDAPILCHNDLVQGNLLFSDTKDYLIDYEYAADNDPFFDLMSFITENDIQDKTLRTAFYCEYFGHAPTTAQMRKLNHYEIAHHVLWCEWAMSMMSLHNEPIYKDIADLKYKRLLEAIANK